MAPNAQAIQSFYATLPILLFLAGIFFQAYWRGRQDTLLLKDILDRLKSVEAEMKEVLKSMSRVENRLTVLETRAGVIYHE